MKLFKHSLGLCAAMATLALSPLCATAATPLAYVGVPDVMVTIDKVGTLGKQLDPNIDAATLKALAGMFLGDAELSGFGKEAGLFAFVTDDGKPMLFLETAEGKAAGYVATLKKQEMAVSVVDGMVAIAISGEASDLAAAKEYAAAAKEYFAKPAGGAKIEVHGEVAAALATYGKDLDAAATELLTALKEGEDENGELYAKAGAGALAFVSSVGKQIKSLDLAIALEDENFVMSIASELVEGSDLAKANVYTADLNVDLLKYVPADGMAMRSIAVNESAGAKFLVDEAEKACKAAKCTDEKTFAKIREYITRAGEAFGSNYASAQAVLIGTPTAENPLAGTAQYFVYELKDVAKARALSAELVGLANDAAKMLCKDTSFTVELKYEKEAGEVAGFPSDAIRVIVKAGEEDMNLEVAKLTAVEDKGLVAVGDADLAKLVDLSKAPATLKPINAPKLEGYKTVAMVEYNLSDAIKTGLAEVAKADESGSMKALLAKFESPEYAIVLGIAGGAKDNKTLAKVSMPLKPVLAIAKFAKEEAEKAQAASIEE